MKTGTPTSAIMTQVLLRMRARRLSIALARAQDLLQRVRDGEPYTARDLDTVIAFCKKAARL